MTDRPRRARTGRQRTAEGQDVVSYAPVRAAQRSFRENPGYKTAVRLQRAKRKHQERLRESLEVHQGGKV